MKFAPVVYETRQCFLLDSLQKSRPQSTGVFFGCAPNTQDKNAKKKVPPPPLIGGEIDLGGEISSPKSDFSI